MCICVCWEQSENASVGSRAARNGFILWSADTVVNICVQAPPITSRFMKVSKHIWGEYLDSFNLYEEGKPSLAGDMDTEGWQRGRWGSGALLTLFWEFYISRYSTFSPPTHGYLTNIHTYTVTPRAHEVQRWLLLRVPCSRYLRPSLIYESNKLWKAEKPQCPGLNKSTSLGLPALFAYLLLFYVSWGFKIRICQSKNGPKN